MPNFLFFLALLFASFHASSSEEKRILRQFIILSVTEDLTLSKDQVALTFTSKNLPDISSTHQLVYSVDAVQSTIELNNKKSFELALSPGKHIFQFYYDDMHYEIYSDSVEFIGQHRYEIELYWEMANMQIMVDKPVIYLYPTVPTLVDVKVEPKGEFTFTYPNYINGWKVEAEPNGDLKHDGKTYNYLFWEAAQEINLKTLDLKTGFVVSKVESLNFLDEKLSLLGMTDKEKADFITFWGPQLNKNEKNFIHFVLNEDCNQFAELTIKPEPAHIYRIYIITFPYHSDLIIEPTEQVLPKMDRSGFTVIEWGGSQLSLLNTELN